MILDLSMFYISIFMFASMFYITCGIWFRHKHTTTLRLFFTMGMMLSFWTLFNGISILLSQELFETIYPVYFTLACFLPTILLWYTLYFTNNRFKAKKGTKYILAVFPTADFILLWTNPWHGKLIAGYDGLHPIAGDLFPVHAILSYTPLLIGVVLIVRHLVRKIKKIPTLGYVGLGVLLMLVSNILYTFGVLNFGFDITPFTFIVMFCGFAVYSSRLRLFEQKENIELAASRAEIERQRVEIERMARQEAEASNKAKSTFLAIVSHEIRTPLNAVIGLSEVILDTEELSDDNLYRLEQINNAGATLLDTVNDILDISKIEAGKLELVPQKYDIPSLINDAVTQSMMHRKNKPIDFIMHLSEDLPAYLYGDELHTRQILNNFLSNAFKYTPEGTVELEINSNREGDSVILEIIVRDTGIGIREEDLPKLFEDYTQIDMAANRKIMGTGLGMPITKKLVEMMDGHIKVDSKYGEGSVFTVLIKQKHVSDEVISPEVIESLIGFNYSIKKSRRYRKKVRVNLPYAHVLIVDDVATNLDVVKGLLKPYNMKIDCVISGQEAISSIRKENVHYNAIFMDHMMPVMDGVEAAQRIREIGTDYAKNIPIIALTANAVVGCAEMFIESGFQDFISKPIDIAVLDIVVCKWIRDREQEKLLGQADVHESSESTADKQDSKDWRAFNNGIPGVNIKRGLHRFAGDKNAYLDVLRSYAKNTQPLIESSKGVSRDKLLEYKTIVHGVKGSSRSIFAEEVGDIAEALENAAFAGDYSYILTHNDSLAEKTLDLISNINKMVERFEADNLKIIKEKPDNDTLMRMRQACVDYNMDEVDAALDELESFSYETNGDLITWLRENVEQMNFDDIIERLS